MSHGRWGWSHSSQSDHEDLRVDPKHSNNAYFLVDKIVNELVDVEGTGVPKEDMAMSVEIEVVNCEVESIPVAEKTYGSVNSATEPYLAISF